MSERAGMKVGDQAIATRQVTEADILAFAELTGDRNPLHLDPEFAKTTRFKRPVAHGVLTTSLVSAALGMELPGPGTVYLEERVRFTAPVFAGDRIEATLTLNRLDDGKYATFDIVCRNQMEFVVLDGTARVYLGYVKK